MASTFTILQEGYVPSKPHINIHLEEEISQNFTLYINKSSTTGNTHVFNNTPDIWLNYMSDLSVTPSEDSLYFYDVDW